MGFGQPASAVTRAMTFADASSRLRRTSLAERLANCPPAPIWFTNLSDVPLGAPCASGLPASLVAYAAAPSRETEQRTRDPHPFQTGRVRTVQSVSRGFRSPGERHSVVRRTRIAAARPERNLSIGPMGPFWAHALLADRRSRESPAGSASTTGSPGNPGVSALRNSTAAGRRLRGATRSRSCAGANCRSPRGAISGRVLLSRLRLLGGRSWCVSSQAGAGVNAPY